MEAPRAESEADAIIAEIDEQPAAPPTSRELGEWIGGGNCPAEALEDAARSLGAMGVICCNSEGTPAIAYGSINPKTLRLESGLLHVELEASTIALRENGKYVRRCLEQAVPGPGFALGCRGPGGCSGPALVLQAGVNRAFQATKKTPRLCAEVSDLIY